MKLIIPMAGRGTRVRPHSHVTPKPLLNVCGKSMVERIVDTFMAVLPRPLDEGIFILGPDFGTDVRDALSGICNRHGMKAGFAVQDVARGTGHAVACAGDRLEGEGIVVFADTLFYMAPGVDLSDADVVAWVKHVDDPSRFGVAVREGDRIVRLVEKPQELISTEALIGIYYVRELSALKRSIQYLFDNELTGAGDEYQLTDAFDHMLKDGALFRTASVSAWLDCGTIEALHATTMEIVAREKRPVPAESVFDSVVIQPVFVADGARIERSVIGPNVSIERGAVIRESIVKESIIFSGAIVDDAHLEGSLIGSNALVRGTPSAVNIGDHSSISFRVRTDQ
jgi:glucose-1-phosphate thymidylyltransferase